MIGPRAAALGLALTFVPALAGCGGSEDSATSSTGFSQLPPGKVPHAAPSSADKEIPTRFGRAISLPYRSTVLYATAISATDPPRSPNPSAGSDKRIVGIALGIRNIGTTGWTGQVAALSRLAVGSGDKPERSVRSFGTSAGRCPNQVARSGAAPENRQLSLAPGKTALECIRFALPERETPILYKFAARSGDYALAASAAGSVYGVWALPGTLVEKCRYEPGLVKGRCQGLESGD